MKHVRLDAADLARFREGVATAEWSPPELERDHVNFQGMDFEVVRPRGSVEPLTCALSISFEAAEARYLCVVRTAPDGGHVLSLTVIRKSSDSRKDSEVQGCVLDSTQLTTLSGRLDPSRSNALYQGGESRDLGPVEFVKMLGAIRPDK